MSVVKVLSAVVVLLLSSLACEQAVVTVTPITPAEAVTTPDNTPTPTPTPRPTGTAAADVAVVAEIVRPVVNYRDAAGGTVIGNLEAGDTVTVLGCIEDGDLAGWCEVEIETEQMFVFVWAGCLSIDSEKGCQAK